MTTVPRMTRTLVDVARWHAETTPDRPAYLFLPDGETEGERLDFATVDRRARAIAVEIRERGGVGRNVLVAYPSGSPYVQAVLGCLYAGAVAVPCDASDRPATAERLRAIARDCAPVLALAAADSPADALCQVLDVTSVPDSAARRWEEPVRDADLPAFLQYTSGSTRVARGVMVGHDGLLANEEAIKRACEHDRDSTFVGWLPLFHDMGLVANVLQPLYLGSLSVLMPPEAFLQDPIRWLRAITKYRAHTSGGPNFSYELCLTRTRPADRVDLDLSSWLVAYNGAEPVRAATIRRFSETFAPHGFASTSHFPCYGLAEATLIVAGTPKSEPAQIAVVDRAELRLGRATPALEGVELVSCGLPVLDTEVTIVDSTTQRTVPPGTVGEVWIRGPGVTRGYVGGTHLADGSFGLLDRAGPFLRTGDLGCFLEDRLYLTGRVKDLLVVRGQNHYPQDLEWTVEQAHEQVRPSCVIAFGVDVHDREELVLCVEVRSDGVDLDEVAEDIRRAVSLRHGLEPREILFVPRGVVPKTSSGKVRRQDCRESYLNQSLSVVGTIRFVASSTHRVDLPSPRELSALAPAVRVERLATALREAACVRRGVPPAVGSVEDSLVACGADSVDAMELGHHLELRYGVRVPGVLLLGDVAVRDLARYVLDAAREPSRVSAAAASDVDWQPLTGAQRALWFEHQLAPESGAYHLARAVSITGPLRVDALTRTMARVVEKHPALRTRFRVREGNPMCRVEADGPALVVDACDEADLDARLAALVDRPFDLTTQPPVRFVLLRRSDQEHVLVLVVHHLLADLWSFVVLMRDLDAFYREETGERVIDVGSPSPGHADILDEETRWMASTAADCARRYWRESLEGAPTVLDLPRGASPSAVRTFDGGTFSFRLPAPLARRLREASRELGCTLYTTLLAGYELLLHRYCAQRDLLVGTLSARRDRADLADVVGYLVNPVPIRSVLDDGQSFRTFVQITRKAVLGAVEHGGLSFDQLVRDIGPERPVDRPPLIQSLFVLQRENGPEEEGYRSIALGVPGSLELSDLTLATVEVPRRWSQLDLTLSMAEIGEEMVGVWEYSTAVGERTVADMSAHFTRLLDAVTADMDAPLRVVDLPSPSERRDARQLAMGPTQHRDPTSIHAMVASMAQAHPDAVAVLADETKDRTCELTYGALHRSATQVAAHLAMHGAGPDVPVALVMERGAALPIAYLAIWHAGSAVLPLDASDPDARLGQLITGTGAPIVVTQRSLRRRIASVAPGAVVLAIEDQLESVVTGVTRQVHRQQSAYVLHTSGSTGSPKGVVVPHEGLLNRILWMQESLGLVFGERVLHKTPTTFDVSLWELFWPLVTGGCLVVARPGGHRDPAYLCDVIGRLGVSTAHFVPTLLQHFLAELDLDDRSPTSLSRVVCSGEVLPVETVDRFRKLLDAELHNLYGPTEASIDVTAWPCDQSTLGAVPIGRPIANTTCAVLDERMRPTPAGVSGELHIGGLGLARGYQGRADLTAVAFVPDPDGSGERLYRSGDVARRVAGGVLEFLGRRDDQVKIGGNRVEPGEVVATLRRRRDVADAAVVVRDQRLVGYVVPASPVTTQNLLGDLRLRLPAFLVPKELVFVDELPVTRSGKLDTRALPAGAWPGRTIDPPQGPTETLLAKIWSDQLRLDTVGATEDFFALGGDSIRAIPLIGAAREAGLALSVTDLLRRRTIRGLANQVDRDGGSVGRGASTPPFALCPEAAGRLGVVDAYPLSMAQRTLLFHRDNTHRYEVYVTSLVVGQELDRDRLASAVEGVMRRHAYLRSMFDLTSYSEPVQLVREDVPVPLWFVDLRAEVVADRELTVRRWLYAERTRGFDVGRGPLVRFTVHELEGEFRLTISSFGLDGWCVASVLTEILDHHHRGQAATQPTVEYADFVALERLALDSAEQRRFWTDELGGIEPCLLRQWPDAPIGVDREEAVRRHIIEVPPEVTSALSRLTLEGVSLKHVLLGVHLWVLRTVTGSTELVTGLECNGRPEQRDGDRVVGVFNNIVPLRVNVEQPGSWVDLSRMAQAAEVRISPFRRYPLAQLQREHQAGRLFDTLFVFTHFHRYADVDVEISALQASDQTYVPLTVHFNREAGTGRLRLLLDVDPRQVSDDQAKLVGDCFESALAAAASNPHGDVRTATLLPPEDAEGAAAYEDPDSVPDMVRAAVIRAPDHVAVSEGDRQLSYSGLWERSGSLAGALSAAGVGRESIVALHAPRRLESVVALLGIQRAGGTHLALDPAYPSHRLREIVIASGTSILVLPPGEPTPEWASGLTVVRTDARGTGTVGAPPTHPDALSCVLATSGSTGVPKLIGVPHRGLVNYLAWSARAYAVTADTVVPVASSLGFDFTVTTLLTPLVAGGRADLVPSDDPSALGDALATGRHTMAKFVPAHLGAIAEQLRVRGRRTVLQTVVVGGEALHGSHVQACRSFAPEAVIINEYGPTETVVGCVVHRVGEGAVDGPVPIGRPIAGASVRVAVGARAAAPGLPGELFVGGVVVTRGYLRQPGATALAFRPDPHRPGGRRYATGDVGRRLPDGDLVFVGRNDRQVKVRGHRVELGELEHVLAGHHAVRDAAVTARRGPGGQTRIIACYVSTTSRPIDDLAFWLRRRLPRSCLPDALVCIPAIPATPNGKVDYERLPDSDRIAILLDRLDRLEDDEVELLLRARTLGGTGGSADA